MQIKNTALSLYETQERSQPSWGPNQRPAESGGSPCEEGEAIILATGKKGTGLRGHPCPDEKGTGPRALGFFLHLKKEVHVL